VFERRCAWNCKLKDTDASKLLEEELKCALAAQFHNFQQIKTNLVTTINSSDMPIEDKINEIQQLSSEITDIESKLSGFKFQAHLLSNTEAGENQSIEEQITDVKRNIVSEIKSLDSLHISITATQNEMNEIDNYIQEKARFLKLQCPVADDAGSFELESIKVLLSEIASWKLCVTSLTSKIQMIKEKPCDFEVKKLLQELDIIEENHTALLTDAELFLEERKEYFDRLQNIDDICELANIWLETKSKETLSLIEFHPLKSNGMANQIAQLQRIFNDIKEYEDDTILKVKELTKLNQNNIISEDLDELKESFVNLKEIILKNIKSLNETFEKRKVFEKSLEHCSDCFIISVKVSYVASFSLMSSRNLS
jgi:cell fate (sporulation/competence/biofilm development) regulator YlbF (YheA/YmcA/DUF963 family)